MMAPGLLTVPQVAERLGLDVRTVRQMIGLGQLPAVRTPGGQARVAAELVEQLVRVEQASYDGTRWALALLDALTSTPEGERVLAAVVRAAQERAEAPHLTGEDGR
jgi:excisionase family DNA binding protein